VRCHALLVAADSLKEMNSLYAGQGSLAAAVGTGCDPAPAAARQVAYSELTVVLPSKTAATGHRRATFSGRRHKSAAGLTSASHCTMSALVLLCGKSR
jgi:hypothetical protein